VILESGGDECKYLNSRLGTKGPVPFLNRIGLHIHTNMHTYILSVVGVTIDGVQIVEWIY
jgi:hypothetical protein